MERQSTEPEDETLETGEKVTYWYKYECWVCLVCGSGEGLFTKTRQYSPKPVDINKRYIYYFRYDYCNSL